MSDDVSTSNNNDVTDELISHAQNSNSLPNLNVTHTQLSFFSIMILLLPNESMFMSDDVSTSNNNDVPDELISHTQKSNLEEAIIEESLNNDNGNGSDDNNISISEEESISWARDPQPSGHCPLKFRDLGAFKVINASAICKSVGFLSMSSNGLYIIG
nr:11822_t:CDS:2 [Entrophospora candida]